MWFHECPQTPAWTALALACPICSMPTILFSQFFCHVGAHRLFPLITWQPKIQAVFCPPGSTCSRTCLRNCHQNRIAGPAAWLSSRPRSQLKKACQFPLGAFIFLFRTHHRFLPNPKTTPIILQIFPQSVFTLNVLHGHLLLHSFYQLAIGAVAQKIVHLGQQCLLWIFIVLAPVPYDFVHEPREDQL